MLNPEYHVKIAGMQQHFFGEGPIYKGPEVDASGKVILSVEECHTLVNEAVGRLGRVRVRGEISKPKVVRDAMAFFDLKDTNGKDFVVRCSSFRLSF